MFANVFIFQIVEVETNILPEIAILEFSHNLGQKETNGTAADGQGTDRFNSLCAGECKDHATA
jgi:hypothetical protein